MSVGKYTPGRRRTNRPRSALRKSARRSPGVTVSRTSTSWEESKSRGVGEAMPLPCSISDIQRVPDPKPVDSAHVNDDVSGWMPTLPPRVTRAPKRSGTRVTRERMGERGSQRRAESHEPGAAQGPSTQRTTAQRLLCPLVAYSSILRPFARPRRLRLRRRARGHP